MSTEIKLRSTLTEKKKKNYELQRAKADMYDTYHGYYRDDEKLKKHKINYDLMNGRLDTALYETDDIIKIGKKEVKLDMGEIPHMPFISQVTNGKRGEMHFIPWNISVEDNSPLKGTIEAEEYGKLIKEYINVGVINPNKQRVLEDFLNSANKDQLALLPPEELDKIYEQLDNQAVALSPSEIVEYMSNDFKNPVARQAQEIMEHMDVKFDIRNQQIDGYTHALATAEEIYYVNVGERGIEFEMVPPDSFSCGGPLEEEDFQKMDWAKRERWTTIQAIMTKYGETLLPEHIKELEKAYEPMFGTTAYDGYYNGINGTMAQKRYQQEFAREPDKMIFMFGNQDYRDKDNFANINNAYKYVVSKYGEGSVMSDFAIREVHIVWRDRRKMFKVYRVENGILKRYYFDEHYVRQTIDIDVQEVSVPEIWECTKIGTENPIYLNIRALPYQRKDIDDPWDVELPYIGRKYNTFKNRSNNVCPIDLMKQFNRDIDTEMASLRKDLRTNLGKQFLMLMSRKPDELEWNDFFNIGKTFGTLLIDDTKKGQNPQDSNIMKDVDLTRFSEIANRIALINQYKEFLYNAGGFNAHSVGQGSQYATNGNIVQQQSASQNQGEPFMETHRRVVEAAMNRLMNVARLYYKDNPQELKYVLSPSSLIELENGYPFWYSYFNIKLENSGRAARQVEMLKQYIQAFIQNGMKPRDVIEMALAESKNDLIDMLNKMDKRINDDVTKAQQSQMEQFQAQLESQNQQRQQDAELKLQLKQMDNQSAENRALIGRENFALAQDIDKNHRSDLVDAKMAELTFKTQEHFDKIKLEYEKLKNLSR